MERFASWLFVIIGLFTYIKLSIFVIKMHYFMRFLVIIFTCFLISLLWKAGNVFPQCNTINNLSFYSSSFDSCQLPQTLNFFPQYQIDQTPVLLKTYKATFTSKQDVDFPMDKNGCVYILKVSGYFGLWANSNDRLDAYAKFGYSGNGFQYIDGTFLGYLSLNPDSGPTAYDPSHVYTYYFNGNSTKLNFKFTDNPYSDNSGSMTLEWYVIPCYSYVWDFGGGNQSIDSIGVNSYAQSGTYQIQYTVYDELNNCNESYSSSINLYSSYSISLVEEICNGQSYSVGNNTHTLSGNYADTLKSIYGCDSIINLSLKVISEKQNYIDTSFCSGSSILIGNKSYYQTGNYIDTLQSNQSCDSIIYLNLIVNNSVTYNIDTAICNGNNFTFGNKTLTKAGFYTDSLYTIYGCDSIVNLNLSIADSIITIIEQSICEGETYQLGSITYNSTGNYSQSYTSFKGCDSIVALYLDVRDTASLILSISICFGETYEMGGNIYHTSGNFIDTLMNANGCDSIIHLYLTVNDTSITYKNISICDGEAFFVGSNMYSSSGTYTDVFQNISGCDSIIETSLSVFPKPEPELGESFTLCNNDFISISPGYFDTYLWNDGSTENSLSVNSSGIYFVLVTDSNLCSLSDTIEISEGGCTSIYIPNTFTPNGDGVNDYFTAIGYNIDEFSLKIFDGWGNFIYSTNEFSNASNEKTGWNGESAANGIYIWQINYTGKNQKGYSFEKIENGRISLVR
jgi:gliding motility-associated-like protein